MKILSSSNGNILAVALSSLDLTQSLLLLSFVMILFFGIIVLVSKR